MATWYAETTSEVRRTVVFQTDNEELTVSLSAYASEAGLWDASVKIDLPGTSDSIVVMGDDAVRALAEMLQSAVESMDALERGQVF